MSILMRIVWLVALVTVAGPLAAQNFPSHPIKVVVPFPAGGPADTIGRILVDKMSSLIGQTMVIENRSGAGGLVGIAQVAKAEPNGYTIGVAPSSGLAMNPNLRNDMPFQPLKDLALLTQIVSVPEILVVNEKVPAKTLAELVALAKAQPGKLVFASTGLGGMPHMAMELLKLNTKIELVHVPYTGAAPAVKDLLGNHVQMMFADVPVLLGSIQSGNLRALAIGSRKRISLLPSVATTAELGMPQVEADNWYGLVAPIGIPQPVKAKLEAAAIEALHSAEVKDKLLGQGIIAVGSKPDEFAEYVKQEIDRWGKVIAATGIKIK